VARHAPRKPLDLWPAISAGKFNPIDVRSLWLIKWKRTNSLDSTRLGTFLG
jgi:hypothetical protein